MSSPKNPDPLYPPREASPYLKQSTSTLAKNRLLGVGPEFLKLGSRVFYRLSALDAYLASCRRRSTSDSVSPK